jgi:hypothetical protein
MTSFLLSRYKKYGDPMMAVIIPEGISIGGMIDFPIRSAKHKNAPPQIADAGIKTLLSAPIKNLTM